MSSEFLKIDEFLLGKGFHQTQHDYLRICGQLYGAYYYEKENKRCKVEIAVGDEDGVRLRLYSKTTNTADYCCVLESEMKWCYLEDLMELLGM